ncbi:MAG: carbohydrate ABC transporter permease, partial [Armatimonadota bacterium]
SSFMWIKDLHLMNTRLALILPYIAGGQVFAIFILRSFMASIPEELFEAARMDGASEFRMFWNIAIPLSMRILGTVAIMNLLGVWNDYIWPLIVISDEAKRTLTIGLAFFRGTYYVNYGTLMAGYVIACLPLLVLFFIAMRYFVEGLTSGALKA